MRNTLQDPVTLIKLYKNCFNMASESSISLYHQNNQVQHIKDELSIAQTNEQTNTTNIRFVSRYLQQMSVAPVYCNDSNCQPSRASVKMAAPAVQRRAWREVKATTSARAPPDTSATNARTRRTSAHRTRASTARARTSWTPSCARAGRDTGSSCITSLTLRPPCICLCRTHSVEQTSKEHTCQQQLYTV